MKEKTFVKFYRKTLKKISFSFHFFICKKINSYVKYKRCIQILTNDAYTGEPTVTQSWLYSM